MAAVLPSIMAHHAASSPASPFTPRPPKRRAPSPPLSSPFLPHASIPCSTLFASANSSQTFEETPAAKKRRPNLANGFSGLTLSSREGARAESPPSYEESQATRHQVDDEDDETPLSPRDIRVQPLPDADLSPYWSVATHASSSASSSTDDDADSDSTFQHRRTRLPKTLPHSQQPDSIETPMQEVEYDGLEVEDVTDPWSPRGRKRRDVSDADDRTRKRRRSHGADDDINMDHDEDMNRGRGARRRTEWHEPEKDRIVITSLGSSPSSSRSSSRERSMSPESRRRLSQPGERGFTLNPSLLTHLLRAQRQNLDIPLPRQEQGLVLYRPLGISAGLPDVEDILRTWQGQVAVDDASRFEEVNDEVEWTADEDGMEMDMDG